MAVMATYFPAPNDPAAYCNNPSSYIQAVANSVQLDPALLLRLDGTGRSRVAGDVKYIFNTRSGPGPIRQPQSESLLDPATGMPIPPQPGHEQMNISSSTH